jgi:hypothetical protein
MIASIERAERKDETMSPKQAAAGVPAETLALYEKLVATAPGIARKGATVPYTSLNGNMFSYLDKSGSLALRLPAEARAAFVAKYQTGPLMPYGVVQPEYVAVPAALLANTAELAPYFAQSVAYAQGLTAKPTTGKTAVKTAAKATSAGSRRRAFAKKVAADKKKKRLAKKH